MITWYRPNLDPLPRVCALCQNAKYMVYLVAAKSVKLVRTPPLSRVFSYPRTGSTCPVDCRYMVLARMHEHEYCCTRAWILGAHIMKTTPTTCAFCSWGGWLRAREPLPYEYSCRKTLFYESSRWQQQHVSLLPAPVVGNGSSNAKFYTTSAQNRHARKRPEASSCRKDIAQSVCAVWHGTKCRRRKIR